MGNNGVANVLAVPKVGAVAPGAVVLSRTSMRFE
jgi:hypothetical protein